YHAAADQVEGDLEAQGSRHQQAQAALLVAPPQVQGDQRGRRPGAEQEAVLRQPDGVQVTAVDKQGSPVAVELVPHFVEQRNVPLRLVGQAEVKLGWQQL